MTLLELTNKVLIKMREAQVTTINDNTYSALCAQFVNEARREVEDAWNWLTLRKTVSINCVPDASQYILTGVGNTRFKILQVFDDTNDVVLTNLNSKSMTRKFLVGTLESGKPVYFGLNGFSAAGDPIVDIFPPPDDAYIIRFNLVIPQNDVEAGPTEIKVPGHLVYLGAYVKALAERGEEGNMAYEVALSAYMGALGSAVSQESALMPDESDFVAI